MSWPQMDMVAAAKQEDLLREAEQYRLAIAVGDSRRRPWLRALAQWRRGRPWQQRRCGSTASRSASTARRRWSGGGRRISRHCTAFRRSSMTSALPEHEPPCCVNDPELWFAESQADVEIAKRLCRDCTVRAACLAGALERREPWGVWGGELFLYGVVIPRRPPRGRPRKRIAAA